MATLTPFVGSASAAMDRENQRRKSMTEIIMRGQKPDMVFNNRKPDPAFRPESKQVFPGVSEIKKSANLSQGLTERDDTDLAATDYSGAFGKIDKLMNSALKEGDNYTIDRLKGLSTRIKDAQDSGADYDPDNDIFDAASIHVKNVKAFDAEDAVANSMIEKPWADEKYMRTHYNIDGNWLTYAQMENLRVKSKTNLQIYNQIMQLPEDGNIILNPNIPEQNAIIAKQVASGDYDPEGGVPAYGTKDDIVKEMGGWANVYRSLDDANRRYEQTINAMDRDDENSDSYFRDMSLDITNNQVDWESAVRSGEPDAIEYMEAAINGDESVLETFRERGIDIDRLIMIRDSISNEETENEQGEE